jgi:hypothetical protein
MNDGVALLLERMKTHPEEFIVSEGYPYEVGSGSKWHKLIESHKLYLNPEDNKVLEEALNGLMQQRFTEKVLEELVDPKKLNPYLVQESATLSGGTTRGLYSNGIGGNATLLAQQQSTVEHMKAHLEVLEMAKKAEVKKEVKTIFGKLFNYS